MMGQMTLVYVPQRDIHLELLDVHLLPLLKDHKRTTAELLEAIDQHKKLSGTGLDNALVQRWLESARTRYFVIPDGNRWALDVKGRERVEQLTNVLKLIGGRVPQWLKLGAAGGGLATVALTVLKVVALPFFLALAALAALFANGERFIRSRAVVEGVVRKEKYVRDWPDPPY